MYLRYTTRFAPHDTAHLIQLMGGNVSTFEFIVLVPPLTSYSVYFKDTFVKRLDHFFDVSMPSRIIYLSGNSCPSFRLATTSPAMNRLSRCVIGQKRLRIKVVNWIQTPIGYHYANHPTKSVDRVREVVFQNFDIS